MRAWATLVIAALMSNAGSVVAKDSSRTFDAVVCTSEAKGSWALKARGKLTRTKAERELIYSFESSEQVFAWRLVTSPQGHTTASGPGFLMERFNALPAQPEPPPRRQTVEATGEIREYAGPHALVLLIRSRCPA